MDKHNRISIKINGKEPKVKKEQQETPEFVESEKPLIVIENDEVAAAQEEEEDDFNWVLPDETNNHSSKEREIPVIPIEDLRQTKTKGSINSSYKPKFKKKKGFQLFSIKQLAVSIALAVVLGTGFGFMILKVVGDVNAGPAENEAPSQPTTSTGNPPPAGEDKDTPASNQATLELESLSTGIIQGGKFSSVESANTTVNEIKAKGFAATAVGMDGAFFVIAGIGTEQGSIGGIKDEYKDAFPEFFAKTFEVPGGTYSNAAKGDSEAIKVSLPVFKDLLSLSSQAFGTGSIDNEQLENVSKQIAVVKDSKADNLHDGLKAFQTELEAAFTQLQAFKGGDAKALWQSQQSLLNAYQAYNNWISEIK